MGGSLPVVSSQKLSENDLALIQNASCCNDLDAAITKFRDEYKQNKAIRSLGRLQLAPANLKSFNSRWRYP